MANVGHDKDSEERQRSAVTRFAGAHGFEISAEFNDPGVSGADLIEGRPGFSAMLTALASNGVRVVIVEDASRFARKLMTQEAGIAILQSLGVKVYTSNGDELTDSDDEMRIAMRQIAGVFAQLERTRLVRKLASGRRKVAATRDRLNRSGEGKCGGPKNFAEIAATDAGLASAIALARSLSRDGASLRNIAAELATAGHLSRTGKPFTPQSIANMLITA